MYSKVIYGASILLLFFSVITCRSNETRAPLTATPSAIKSGIDSASKESWQIEWQKTMNISKKEGKVVVYLEASASPAREPLMKAMKEKLGLESEILSLVSGELNARVLNERKAGLFYNDIVITGGGSMANTLIPAGVFSPLGDTFITPDVKEEKNWRDGKIPWFDKAKMTLTMVLFVQEAATLNSNLVKKDELKSYSDLLNPRWKGRIVMNDPTIPGKGINIFQTMRKLMGENFLRDLAKQDIIFSRDHRQLADWLAQGKYALGLAISTPIAEEVRLAGASIDYIELKEGAGLTSGGSIIGIMDKAPHQNASKVFINWLLSKEGQDLWSTSLGYVSRRVDTATAHLNQINIPKPGIKYIDDTEEFYQEWPDGMKLARDIFMSGPH